MEISYLFHNHDGSVVPVMITQEGKQKRIISGDGSGHSGKICKQVSGWIPACKPDNDYGYGYWKGFTWASTYTRGSSRKTINAFLMTIVTWFKTRLI